MCKMLLFSTDTTRSKVMNPINTLNQTATTQVAVKSTNRKAKMLARLNTIGKRLALGGAAQYK